MKEPKILPLCTSASPVTQTEAINEKLHNYLSRVYGLDTQCTIAVLLSGGVDSSVVLASLKRYGCQNLSAYYLKIWFQDDARFMGDCPWEEDLEYAAKLCEQLDIPLHVVPLQQEYYEHVVAYTLKELRSGRTPSPDLFCNQLVKFGAFLRHLPESSLIASGHYALLRPVSPHNINDSSREILLQQAPDPIKDQSYFLSQLGQMQLKRLLFPLGCLHKLEVRCLARYWKLPTAERKDSQGICFLGKIKFRDFAQYYLGQKPGSILNIDTGAELGQHKGLWFYTIGQRQGLGLGGGPWYICAKDMKFNRLYVRHGAAQKREIRAFWIERPNWLQSRKTWEILRQNNSSLQLKLRHGPVKIACHLQKHAQNEPLFQYQVCMQRGDRAVAPGQFAVFYWGDICLGSATILVHSEPLLATIS